MGLTVPIVFLVRVLDHALCNFPDMQNVEKVVCHARFNELTHGYPAGNVVRIWSTSEHFEEVIDYRLAALRPLHEQAIVVASVFGRVIARVHWQQNECDIDKDRNDALELFLAQHRLPHPIALTFALIFHLILLAPMAFVSA